MKKKLFKSTFYFMLLLCIQACNQGAMQTKEHAVDFGDAKALKFSEILNEYSYLDLETSEESLFGKISQLEIFNDQIYILDNHKSNALFVFSKEGKFINKIMGQGDGPGEFISPHSFWIDKSGYLFILDRSLNRLSKYEINSLQFIDQITLPAAAPISFAVMPNSDLFVYYYPQRKNNNLDNKQIVFADKTGTIKHKLLDAPPSGAILHGNSANFYMLNNEMHLYPYFSNNIFTVNTDTLTCKYSLLWGKHSFPDEAFFEKAKSSSEVMKNLQIGSDDQIRLLYGYETDKTLLTKYYIKKDFYFSAYNKENQHISHEKHSKIVDDLGIGNVFPLPIATFGEKFVGAIDPFDIEYDQVTNTQLNELLKSKPKDGNPILFLYTVK